MDLSKLFIRFHVIAQVNFHDIFSIHSKFEWTNVNFLLGNVRLLDVVNICSLHENWKPSSFRATSFSFLWLLLLLLLFYFSFSLCRGQTNFKKLKVFMWRANPRHKLDLSLKCNEWCLLSERVGDITIEMNCITIGSSWTKDVDDFIIMYYLMKNVCSQQDSIIVWWVWGDGEYMKSHQTFATIEISDFKTPKYLVEK